MSQQVISIKQSKNYKQLQIDSIKLIKQLSECMTQIEVFKNQKKESDKKKQEAEDRLKEVEEQHKQSIEYNRKLTEKQKQIQLQLQESLS